MKIALSFALAACHIVDGPNITARDAAAADPAFIASDPAAILVSAPLPGVRRLLRLPHSTAEICFERATTTLTAEELLPILRKALDIEAELEILDLTRSPIPRGSLEFTRAGLSNAGLWRGRVRYDENRSAPVWAKVRIATQQTWIEATELLPAGRPISESQLQQRTGPRFPFGPAPAAAIAGRVPLRPIKPGEAIFASMLIAPHDVERDEKVSVEVRSGEARLSFDAVAETSARAGETVLIKNPENGRRFQARVEAKGKVVVTK